VTKNNETRSLASFKFYIKFSSQAKRHSAENSPEKVAEQRKGKEKRSETDWAPKKDEARGKKALFTQICLMHLKYVVLRYLSFTSA